MPTQIPALRHIVLTFFIFFQGQLFAQSSQKFTIGDRLPNPCIVNRLINYPRSSLNLSAFKDKLIILEFWNTTCASCIEGFPKLLELQKKYKDSIMIILINSTEDSVKVRNLYNKKRKVANLDMNLPTSCGDTIFSKYFSIESVPHVVWIDANSRVRSITSQEYLSQLGISMALNEDFNMNQKTDLSLQIDMRQPIYKNDSNAESILWQSTLSKYKDGMTLSNLLTANDSLGYSIYNCTSVEALYRYAYSNRLDMFEANFTPITVSRTFFDVSDKLRYADRINGIRQSQNLYVYQLIAGRKSQPEQMLQMMQQDLKRYFGFNANWVKKSLPCLVLKLRSPDWIKYSGGRTRCEINDISLNVNGITVTALIKWLEDGTQYYFSNYPIIDETGYKDILGNISVTGDIYDYKALSKGLEKYGLALTLENRVIPVLQISD